ncbi:MAG: hypothetical protein QOG33_2766 [Gaiellales bacterium]|jgi:hypothetical protein|nr:hypothetical protein [Gaiellales bacterium]
MNTSRSISSSLAAAALAATLAACGGGSAHPSKVAFIKQADAVCLKGSAAQSALSQPSSNAQLPGYVKRIYAIERGVVSNVRALTPPTGDQATVSSMLDNVDKALAFESNVEAAAATGNQSQINDAQAMGAKYLNQANTAATRYGFKECGNT